MSKVLAHSLTALISSATTLAVCVTVAVAHLYGAKIVIGAVAVLQTIAKQVS